VLARLATATDNIIIIILIIIKLATNCVFTAHLCHVDIVRLLCSELSLIGLLSSLLMYACSVFFNKLNNNNSNNNTGNNIIIILLFLLSSV